MTSLIFLSDNDFSKQVGKKGNLLCTNISGISFLLIYATQCKHCNNLYPDFKKLSTMINQCQFVILNLEKYPIVARISQETIMPILSVPFLVLYVNGRPFIKYTGTKDIKAMGTFLTQMIPKINEIPGMNQDTNNRRSEDRGKRNDKELIYDDEMQAEIEKYKGGAIPYNIVCEGEVCYLKAKDLNKR